MIINLWLGYNIIVVWKKIIQSWITFFQCFLQIEHKGLANINNDNFQDRFIGALTFEYMKSCC